MQKSFYDLDYIIEINEKRHEQYTSAYQKVLERYTNIILIYSVLSIYLIPLIQEICLNDSCSLIFILCFLAFAILFIISITFTIRLIIPVEVAYLEIPKRYYDELRLQYETTNPVQEEVKNLLKASYITELEIAVTTNENVFRKKSSFYYNALMFALLSSIPYLFCLGFHISKKEDKIQKIEIINNRNNSNFTSEFFNNMSKATNTKNNADSNKGAVNKSSTKTNLPGITNSQIIVSKPNMIKENSQSSSTKKQ